MWDDWQVMDNDIAGDAAAYLIHYANDLPDLIRARACYILAYDFGEYQYLERAHEGLAAAKRLVDSAQAASKTPPAAVRQIHDICEEQVRDAEKYAAKKKEEDAVEEAKRRGTAGGLP